MPVLAKIRSLATLTITRAVTSCMSAGPSRQALNRVGPDAPGTEARRIPNDAVVRITFPNPALQPAISGLGEATTLPPARMAIARVTRRTGDTLWTAISQVSLPDGGSQNYPARGPHARLVPVPLDGSTATVQILNAHPWRVEAGLTMGLVTFVAMLAFIIAYCSQEPCMQ